MTISLDRAAWESLISEARSSANEIDTTSMNIDMQRTTKEYFTSIEEVAEILNQMTRDYISIALTDLTKMQDAAHRRIEHDANDRFDLDPNGFGPVPV